jgi:hypothetical protein
LPTGWSKTFARLCFEALTTLEHRRRFFLANTSNWRRHLALRFLRSTSLFANATIRIPEPPQLTRAFSARAALARLESCCAHVKYDLASREKI